MKPICTNCKYRGTVPNSCHSSCHHPIAQEIVGNSDTLLSMMKSLIEDNKLGYTGSLGLKLKKDYEEYALSNGYFIFPINFDPGWIENCNGFEEAK